MSNFDLITAIEPFEIASIRPPTENQSLSFRVTRSCYWNKCNFCPVYKTIDSRSKRSLEEVKADISNARRIDDLISETGVGMHGLSSLAGKIKKAKNITEADITAKSTVNSGMDERMQWFMSWFKDKPVLEDSLYHVMAWRMGGGKTCFIGDADSLVLRTDFLHEVIDHIKKNFSSLDRFTIYGRSKTAAVRPLGELKEFCNAGIHRVHFGLESGSDKVLTLMNKGVTSAEHIEGCLKIKDAGMSCSVYIMPGLGGSRLSQDHAYETARVINAIKPDYVRLRTLELFPMTPLMEMSKDGTFMEASEEEVVQELKILVENIKCDIEFLSDSATNLLSIFGALPRDRNSMLNIINSYLALSPREKLEFSFSARLRSFMGQYGTISDDIYTRLSPFIVDGAIKFEIMSDSYITSTTALIRSKLMP